MTEGMHGACWTEDRALAVLQTVALANSEAEFLAVHQPIRDFRVSSPSGLTFEATDEALLLTLSNPETRYAFCVIEGEPGAGKSHLIRWLKVKWNDRDLVMLIERADGSLTGTLRQLRDCLGGRYAHLFDNLTQSVEASFEGRVKLFHANLAASLSKSFFEQPLGDEAWCGTWQLERLIGDPTVQEKWHGPERILKIMSGDGGHRNSASAAFDLYDIADLANVQSAVDGLPPKALMLMRTLKKECDRILPARAQGVPAADLALDETLELPQARRLMDALNLRRNFAVQRILGITVDGLRTMFFNLRKELLREGRRLVLLLEDVTSWEGIDGQLIDSLVVDARARDDVCDMISVVGMTPLYLRDMQGNYGGRISYILRLGRARPHGGFQDTIQLASDESQIEFVSRYLRAVRISRPELDAWHRAGADPDLLRNKCDTCEARQMCFAAFGSVNQIGLFPLNANAITNIFSHLEDPKGSQNLQTPRGMIQGVLSPVLMHPARLDAGEFPPIEIEMSEWMPGSELQPSGFMTQVIEAAEQNPDRRGQLRRLTMLWGDRSSDIRVTQSASGARYFSGIAEGVFDAFGLPWLGEGLESGGATVLPATDTSVVPTPHGAAASAAGTTGPTQTPDATPTRPVPVAPQKGTPTVSAGRLKALLEQAQLWRDGNPLTDVSAWEILLAELMSEVKSLLLDPAPGIWDRLFTRDAVKLEGSGRVDTRHFVIPREDWATRGLEAYLQLRIGTTVQSVQLESNRRAVARMLRRLTELAESQISRRLAQEGAHWSVAAVAAQVLLARAWLRGAVSPRAPLPDQFEEILSDEQDARSMPDDRVESWSDLIRATAYYHDKLRSILRQSLILPLGDGAPLIDAGLIASAMHNLKVSMRGVEIPANPDFTRGLDDISKLLELARQMDSQLRYIPDREAKSLQQRKAKVLALLRKSTLNHHIGRVNGALDGAASAMFSAAPVEREAYVKACDHLGDMGLLDEDGVVWNVLKGYLLAEAPVLSSEAECLAYVLDVPVAGLGSTLDTLEKAEVAIGTAFSIVRAYVESHQTEGELSVVQSFGQQLAKAAEALDATIGEVE